MPLRIKSYKAKRTIQVLVVNFENRENSLAGAFIIKIFLFRKNEIFIYKNIRLWYSYFNLQNTKLIAINKCQFQILFSIEFRKVAKIR